MIDCIIRFYFRSSCFRHYNIANVLMPSCYMYMVTNDVINVYF